MCLIVRLCASFLIALTLCSCAAPDKQKRFSASISEDEQDACLQRAATQALGNREGTVIVIDPQNGRLRAVVNSRLAFEQAFPPGSAIKPFTALAALEAGLIDNERRVLCPERYRQGSFEILCSHPKVATPLDLTQALAYSCNNFFATISERLSASAWHRLLGSFGFGARTGVNAVSSESAGKLERREWHVSSALGESDALLATPIQLLTAYTALVNGGHRFRPQQASSQNFHPHEIASIPIARVHRAALIKGMRDALLYGTAAASMSADRQSYPFTLFGKTGTSTASNEWRTQGWFVSFAADKSTFKEVVPPKDVQLGVLVFLRRAHGAEGAEIARAVFDEYGRIKASSEREGQALDHSTDEESSAVSAHALPSYIRIHSVSTNTTKSIPIEKYIHGVLIAEASIERELEALKAQAVASRTFALRNLNRHAAKGYDVCSTTHCQRYGPEENGSSHSLVKDRAWRGVKETSGEVLRDQNNQLAHTYFHAACGGMTANIKAVWGDEDGESAIAQAPTYLRGVADDYCQSMPHHRWTQIISASDLERAVRRDPSSNIGARLREIKVMKRDGSGRAEVVRLEGERTRELRGWDFKLIVSRTLGWQTLKSVRFDVERVGEGFVFRGGGFGHGLGLCQEGAHVMARRGASYKQILGFYYPGTSIEKDAKEIGGQFKQVAYQTAAWQPLTATASSSVSRGERRASLQSEHFRVSYPARMEQRQVELVLRTLEAARSDLRHRLAAASLNPPESDLIDVIVHRTTADFMATTGQSAWAAAATTDRRIELQPLEVLRHRGILTMTLRHEYAHAVIEAIGGGHTPRWLAEGLATHVSGEGAQLMRYEPKTKLTLDELNRRLASPTSLTEMRVLYAAAYRELRALLRTEGEAGVWRRVKG